jgi:hypothetical protein
MIIEREVIIFPDDINDSEKIISEILLQTKTNPKELLHYKILKRSIDARGKHILYRLKVYLYLNEHPVFDIHYIPLKE